MNPSGEYKGTTYSNGWNKDGWPASSMRSYLSTTIYNTLPIDLQSVIIDTKVVSGYGHSDTSNFISTDKLYLLDSKEVFGTSFTDSYNTSKDNERQLDYYLVQGVTSNDHSKAIKQKDGSNYPWWFRTAYFNNNSDFYGVSTTGSYYDPIAYYTGGVSPAFRIA